MHISQRNLGAKFIIRLAFKNYIRCQDEGRWNRIASRVEKLQESKEFISVPMGNGKTINLYKCLGYGKKGIIYKMNEAYN